MRKIIEAQNKLALNGLANDKFLVMEDMTLETREGDVKFLMGEEVILGANNDNLVIKAAGKTLVVEDNEVGLAIVNNVVCKEELSDVKYKKMTFLEAKNMRIVTSNLIKAVADTDEIRAALKDSKKRKDSLYEMKREGVALPVVMKENSMDYKAKAMKICSKQIDAKNALVVEAVEINETPAYAKDCLMLESIRLIREADEVENAEDMMADAENLGATIDTDDATGDMVAKKGDAVVGYFDRKNNVGVIFSMDTFNNVDELKDAFKDAGVTLKSKAADLEKLLANGKEEDAEEALNNFANSDKKEECGKECKTKLINCGLSDDMAEAVMDCFK